MRRPQHRYERDELLIFKAMKGRFSRSQALRVKRALRRLACY